MPSCFLLLTSTVLFPDYGYSEWAGDGAAVCSNGIRSLHCVSGCLPPAAGDVWGSDRGHEKRDQRERWSHTSWWVWTLNVFVFNLATHESVPITNALFFVRITFLPCAFNGNSLCEFITEPSKELRSMLRHLLEMMPASTVSGPGRDSAINLLVKQVPRKSLKNPDNSLTLWVISQGMKHTCTSCRISYIFILWWIQNRHKRHSAKHTHFSFSV